MSTIDHTSNHRWALLVLLTATFMSTLDFFIVNVALPSIQHGLGGSSAALEWVVAGYGLTFGTLLIMGSRLGDHYGKRRMFELGLLLFVLTSAICGASTSIGLLILARLAQGVSAALMSPQVLSIITATYEGTERTKAVRAYGITLGLAAVLGQLVGGLLMHFNIAHMEWRTCFYINVPIGLVALSLAPRMLSEIRLPRSSRLDLTGSALLILSMVALILPLTLGQADGWPLWVWFSFIASALLLYVFVAWERHLSRTQRAPLLSMALFHDRAFSIGIGIQLIYWFGVASFFLVLALYLQRFLQLSPLMSGVVFTAFGGGYLLSSLYAHTLLARFGRKTISFGAIVMALGLAITYLMTSMHGNHSALVLVPGLTIQGLGMGVSLAPLVATIVSEVEPKYAGAVSGVLATTQQLGNAIGIAIIGMVFYSTLALQHSYSEAFRASVLGLIVISVIVAVAVQLLPKKKEA